MHNITNCQVKLSFTVFISQSAQNIVAGISHWWKCIYAIPAHAQRDVEAGHGRKRSSRPQCVCVCVTGEAQKQVRQRGSKFITSARKTTHTTGEWNAVESHAYCASSMETISINDFILALLSKSSLNLIKTAFFCICVGFVTLIYAPRECLLFLRLVQHKCAGYAVPCLIICTLDKDGGVVYKIKCR